MAASETAKLIAQLSLDDKMSPGLKRAARSLGKFEGGLKRVGTGLRTAGRNAGIAAAGIAVGVAAFAKGGIESLAELEDATTSVDGAIKTMGLTGAVTAGQIAVWANEIEAGVQAAFDDKAIVSATTNLIRYGKLAPESIQPAMQIMTDLAAKTGDVDSASTLLAKALADPAKAAGKLSKAGVVLTKEQQKQIKAFVKAGKVGKAQGVILEALTETTKGAAAASAGPYRDSLNILADVTEDAQRALGEGFLPIIKEVSSLLTGELAKPGTINNIKAFGTAIAGGLKSLIGIAKGLPWGAIGASLKLAGAGAKTVLDAFVGLPPWVQTAVLTGWGLNKVSGGLLGDVFTGLASGLIKGVLGMNAGVVNINAGVVKGPGGLPIGGGVPGAAGGAGGIGGALAGAGAGVVLGGTAIGVAATAIGAAAAAEFNKGTGLDVKGGEVGLGGIVNGLHNIVELIKVVTGNKPVDTKPGVRMNDVLGTKKGVDALGVKFGRFPPALDKVKQAQIETKREAARGLAIVKSQTQTSGSLVANTTRSSAAGIEAAVRASRPIITTNVNVSATSVTTVITKTTRSGPIGGSRNQDGGRTGSGHTHQ